MGAEHKLGSQCVPGHLSEREYWESWFYLWSKWRSRLSDGNSGPYVTPDRCSLSKKKNKGNCVEWHVAIENSRQIECLNDGWNIDYGDMAFRGKVMMMEVLEKYPLTRYFLLWALGGIVALKEIATAVYNYFCPIFNNWCRFIYSWRGAKRDRARNALIIAFVTIGARNAHLLLVRNFPPFGPNYVKTR